MKYYDLLSNVAQIEIKYRNKYTEGSNEVKLKKNNNSLGVFIECNKPFKYVKLTWRLPNCFDDALCLGDEFERGYGAFKWAAPDPAKTFFWYLVASDKKQCFGYGVMTGCSSFAMWRINNDSLTLELDCRCGTLPVILNGRSLHACDIISVNGNADDDPHTFMSSFCRAMCPTPKLPKHPVYGTNTWYYAFTKTSSELVKMDADLLAECTEGLENRPYMVIDDGWESINMNLYALRKEPLWIPNAEKFPDMPGIVEYIRSKNERPGIWVRFLIGSRKTPNKWRTKPHFPFDLITLDPSRPEVLQHVSDTISKIRGWGFELIKHDFSTYDLFRAFGSDYNKAHVTRRFYDRNKTTAEIALEFYRTIRRAAGDDCVIIGCNTISHLSAGIFELERIGDDTSPSRWDRVVEMGVNCLAFRACQHNTFYACDADCVGHTGEIDWTKNRQWLDLVAQSGTPLFTSIDPRIVTDEIKSDLKDAYKLASEQQKTALPDDWFENPFPESWSNAEDEKFVYDFSH